MVFCIHFTDTFNESNVMDGTEVIAIFSGEPERMAIL